MKRVFAFIVPFILIASLCAFIFNLPNYNFVVQFSKLQDLEFPNALDEFIKLFEYSSDNFNADFFKTTFRLNGPALQTIKDIADFFENIGEVFGFLGRWFQAVGTVMVRYFLLVWEILKLPVMVAYDFLLDAYSLLRALLIMLGFNI